MNVTTFYVKPFQRELCAASDLFAEESLATKVTCFYFKPTYIKSATISSAKVGKNRHKPQQCGIPTKASAELAVDERDCK